MAGKGLIITLSRKTNQNVFIFFILKIFMNWKKGFGIGLLFIGVFIIFTSRVLTGAVIGAKPENYLGILGILVFVVGIVILFLEREKEKKVI